jgi:hypothetical protein
MPQVRILGLGQRRNQPHCFVTRYDFTGRGKPGFTDNIEENFPQGLKPIVYFQAFAARLKSCPDAYGLVVRQNAIRA